LRDKLGDAGVDLHLSAWILDYLTNRPQFVRIKDCQSDTVVCSTGVPQGTVLAPFLFTLYTADFTCNTSDCYLQKFSDDSAVVGLIFDGDDRVYRELNQDTVDWCNLNHVVINAAKTKELVVDFHRIKHVSAVPVNIQGVDIEIVDSNRYLGFQVNNKLDCTDTVNTLYKKGQKRLFLLRRLRSFGVQGSLLRTFYDSVVTSTIFFGVVCWSSCITTVDRKRLNKLIKKAGSVLGCSLEPVEVVGERRVRAKFPSMLETPSHPLYGILTSLRSSFSGRLIHPRCSGGCEIL